MPLAGYIPIGDKVISSNVLVPIKSCALLLIANPINAAHTPFPQFATYVEKYFIRGNCCVRCFVIMIPRLVKKKERKKKVKIGNVRSVLFVFRNSVASRRKFLVFCISKPRATEAIWFLILCTNTKKNILYIYTHKHIHIRTHTYTIDDYIVYKINDLLSL